jgi:hypothetical protein
MDDNPPAPEGEDPEDEELGAPAPSGSKLWWWVAGAIVAVGVFLLVMRWRAQRAAAGAGLPRRRFFSS